AVRDAHLILHLVDASRAGTHGVLRAVGDVDYQVAQFAQIRDGYVILANKMDLPGAQEGLERIRREFSGHAVIPVSALHSHGFKDVKRFVWRWTSSGGRVVPAPGSGGHPAGGRRDQA